MVNVQPSNVSEALAGKRPIPEVWIFKIISNLPKIDNQWLRTGEGEMLQKQSLPGLVSEEKSPVYGNGKSLTPDEMEKMLARLSYRVGELTEQNESQQVQIDMQSKHLKEIELWREQMTKHIARVLGYLNEIDGLKKDGKWPK